MTAVTHQHTTNLMYLNEAQIIDHAITEDWHHTKLLSELIPSIAGETPRSKPNDHVLENDVKVTYFPSGATWREIAQFYSEVHQDSDEPFLINDLSVLLRKFHDWQRLLPNVKPHYAVKSNDNPVIVKFLSGLGVNFDCASVAEIKQVKALPGVVSGDIVYGNPCKSKNSILYAKSVDVRRMTFDCVNELEKIHSYFPEAEVILRIKVDDSGAICQLGTKFGALPHECDSLVAKCHELGLNLIGVSFHVGSGQKRARAFIDALRLVSGVFERAKENHGIDLRFLDIGGGFPGSEVNQKFEKFAVSISQAVSELFPHCHVIAEPGRFFSSAMGTLLTRISTKKSFYDEQGDLFFKYYINDGVYASFNNVLYDYAEPEPRYLCTKTAEANTYHSTVYGPTCDSLDTIIRDYPMPELEVDSFIYWENMGAYTSAAASSFNGCPVASHIYVFRE